MSKRTPGPWVLEFSREIDRRAVIFAGSGHTRFVVMDQALASTPNDPTAEQDRANARLMAAAPEMLAALKTAEIELQEYVATLPKPHDCEKSLATVQAVIAKAEGRP